MTLTRNRDTASFRSRLARRQILAATVGQKRYVLRQKIRYLRDIGRASANSSFCNSSFTFWHDASDVSVRAES